MAQKIVVKVPMADEKTRTEAMQIAAGVGGVIKSVTIDGGDRDQLVVVGTGVDSVKLAKQLRDGMGFGCSCTPRGLFRRRAGSVHLVSVGPAAEEKKQEPKKEEPQPVLPLCHCSCTTSTAVPPYQLYEIPVAAGYGTNYCHIL